MTSGGVAAAFGFRYQNLVTVELLLDLYESSSTDWLVAVDLRGQDSADILVYPSANGTSRSAIQVKASLPTSVTTMGKPDIERLLEKIDVEHPVALERVVRTNRRLTEPASDLRDDLQRQQHNSAEIRRIVDARDEDVREVTDRLIDRIATLRQRGGIGAQLHHILLALLLDMVQQRGSDVSAQLVDQSMVAAILDEHAATLADAQGRRSWGLTYGTPDPDAVDRPEIFEFFSQVLDDEALRNGKPCTAVLSGSPGTGKSVAAGLWAARRREHYAITIWLDATSSERLAEQLPALIRWLDGDAGSTVEAGPSTAQGSDAEPTMEDLAQSFQDSLAALPVPWLLVLDGAVEHADLRPWIPASGYGHTVITTHRSDWPHDLEPQFRIETMPDATATALIRHRLADHGSTWEEPLDPIAIDFVRRLGRWPLAIDLACSWVRRLGGDLSRLPDFTKRLDRFHITAEDGVGLGGYPRAVGILVAELWDSLSESAQRVLAMVVSSGGVSVPIGLLEAWGRVVSERLAITIDVQSAVHELVSVSLLTQRLRGDAHSTSSYDEIVSSHDGIRITLEKDGIEVPALLTYGWLEVCAEAMFGVIGQGWIAEAEALATPIGSFLERLLVSTVDNADDHDSVGTEDPGFSVVNLAEDPADTVGEDPDDRGARRVLRSEATTVMHNLGSLDLLSGRYERAAFWLSAAVQVREELGADVDEVLRSNFAAMQIQTFGPLIQVEVHRRAFERIRPIALRALEYAEDPRVFDVTGIYPPIAAVLQSIAEITRLASEDCSDLREQIEQLLKGRDTASPVSTALDARVQDFRLATQRAFELAEAEQWSRAVEAVLAAVAPSTRDGALLSESIAAVLDVGLILIGSMLRRSPDTLAGSWWSAIRRLSEWCGTVEITDQRQQVKTSFLSSIAEADVKALDRAIADTSVAAAGDQQLEVWTQFADYAKEWLDRPSNRVLFGLSAMVPGIIMFRRVGLWEEETLFRPVLHEGFAGLVVHTPGLLVRTVDGEFDHARHTLLEHGFPDGPSESGAIRVAEGWDLRIDIDREGGCALADPRGEVLYEFEPAAGAHMGAWREAVEHAGMVSIICRDPADAEPSEVFGTPEQGLVRVSGPQNSQTHATGLRGWIERFRHRRGRNWHA